MRDREPVEIVLIAVPVLAEAAAIVFTVAVAVLICGIRAGAI